MEARFQAKDIETKWHARWAELGAFSPRGEGKPFTIVIPPPNVTGALHLGHALNNTIQDILTRTRRKQGRRTLWIPGTDHAGIATQAVVEKRLFEQEKKTRHDLGREELVRRIWAWKDEYEKRITGQLRSLGSSCDWSRQRFTLDAVCAKAVRHAFFNLFRKGLIYRGKRLVNWDTHLQTAVADDEIYYEPVKGKMYYFRYPLADGSGSLPVATTRPETILGDTAVAVHPTDPRYQHLIGRMLKVPFVDREIPVIADALLVDPEFGTGCVKVTPAHDPNDYQTGLRHKLPMINIMDAKGTINENGGPFAGQDRYKAREALVAALETQGLLEKIEDHDMQVGKSDRSKTVIEPWLSDQWFVKMDQLAEDAMEAVRSGAVRIVPERYSRTYLDWLGEKRDWCISRQLWWGHQIPIWRGEGITDKVLEKAFAGQDGVFWYQGEDGAWLVCSRDSDLAADSVPGHTLVRDPDVLDTWFSSALWPHSTQGWPDTTGTLAQHYPTDVLVTSRDIITLWVARMVIFSQQNMGTIPFHTVFIHPKILDGQGRTMSKSLGNGVDPLDIIEKYGADALRFGMAQLCTENQDARLPVKPEKLEDGRTINTSDRFEIGRNFANKLWNAVRYLKPHLDECPDAVADPALFELQDRWILSRLASTNVAAEKAIDEFRFADLVGLLYHFVWDDVCSRYLEIQKSLIAGPDSPAKRNAMAVLTKVLKVAINLLHPIQPFVTEELNENLFPGSEALTLSSWPVADLSAIDRSIEADFERIFAVVEGARGIRGRYSVAPAVKLSAVLRADSENAEASLRTCQRLVQDLAGLSDLSIAVGASKPEFSASVVVPEGELFVRLEGILDRQAELARLRKDLEKATNFAASIRAKLTNPGFARAPANVIEAERQKLATQEDIIAKCGSAIAELE